MTLLATCKDLLFECFEVRLCMKKFFFLSLITNSLLMIMSLMLFCVEYDSVWLLSLLYFLINTHCENSINLARSNGPKVQKSGGPVQEICSVTSKLLPPNFVKFYLWFVLAYPENFMCLASVVKQFEFWRPRFRRNPPFWCPQTLF